jgi:hypothetical protein
MSTLLELCKWLGSTQGSVALLESTYMWLIVESLHVLFITIFVGLTATFDLRLLGLALVRVPVSKLQKQLFPLMVTGFIIMVITGVLLFYSKPVRNFQNIFFRVKFVLLILSGLNAFLFHNGVYRAIGEWDEAPVPPRRARIAGALSLSLWGTIIVLGRLIAYNWFDKLFQ